MKPTTPKVTVKVNPVTLLFCFAVCLVILNFVFILLARSEAKTTELLKKELESLETDNRVIASANQIYDTYQNEIDTISDVFPSEENFPLFIQTLESTIRAATEDYSLNFVSILPIKEQDTLFIPITLTLKTDFAKLILFFEHLENLPYMTHIQTIHVKSPNGFTNGSEIQIGLKVYVQNPFTAQ